MQNKKPQPGKLTPTSAKFKIHLQQQARKKRKTAEAAIIRRYFTQLDPVANAYYELATPITLTGDFEIDYATTSAAAMNFTDTLGVNSSGVIQSDNATDVEVNGVSVGLGATLPLDGKLNHIKFIGLTAVDITVFGRSGAATNYFDGIPSDVKITDKSGAEDVTTTFALDSGKDIELSKGTTLGDEMWDSPILNGWTNNGNGSYSLVNDGAWEPLRVTGLIVDKFYLLSFYCETPLNDLAYRGLAVYGSGDQGWYSVAFKADSTTFSFSRSSGGADADMMVSNVSIREIQGNALTRINVDDADIELFEKSGNQWDNISSLPQELPAVIQIATQA